jgi:hypothetical protein
MRITFRSTLPQDKVNEGSQFNVYVKVWDDTAEPWVAQVPTSVRYRVMNGYYVIQDWATVSAASSFTISITATMNAMIDPALEREVKELVVQCDNGLDTQYAETFDWTVQNLTAI